MNCLYLFNLLGFIFIFHLFSQICFAQSTLDIAVKLFEARKTKDAKVLIEQVLNNEPKNSKALFYLGSIYLELNDYENAIEYLEKALEIEPSYAQYYNMLGRAYAIKAEQAGIFKKPGAASNCKKYLIKSVDLAPDSIEYRIDRLQFYLQAPGIWVVVSIRQKIRRMQLANLMCSGDI